MGNSASANEASTAAGPRLRGKAEEPPELHIVLVEPEIPPNTGNIARLCAATQAHLHLIHPLGFSVSEKAVRRAGLDYWDLVKVHKHDNFQAYLTSRPDDVRHWLLSGKASRSYLEVEFLPGDSLVFGKESAGLDESLLEEFKETALGIPTLGAVRSLNLSNAVAIVAFEALRQFGALEGASLR